MAGEVEALGAFTTAGLAASAIDPARADVHGQGHGPAPYACANCATALVGDYCHACGQQGHVHRSIGHVVEEFLHGVWHFDSKAWRTLPLLVFRPGKLTWDYVHGKRARYIAPLALFLLTVFTMFFAFGFVGGPDVDRVIDAANADSPVAEAQVKVGELEGEVAGARADLAAERANPDATPASIAALETALAAETAKLQTAQAAARRSTLQAGQRGRWQDQLAAAVRNGEVKINSGSATINQRVRDALLSPDFALYRIQQKAYKLSFLLVPLSLPTLWLMFFWKRDVRTYDHVVFTLYSLSFMSLLFVVIALLVKLDPTASVSTTGDNGSISSGIAGFLFFAPPIHIFAQLKGGYRLSTLGAVWRTVVLSIAAVTTLSLFAALIVVLGLAD